MNRNAPFLLLFQSTGSVEFTPAVGSRSIHAWSLAMSPGVYKQFYRIILQIFSSSTISLVLSGSSLEVPILVLFFFRNLKFYLTCSGTHFLLLHSCPEPKTAGSQREKKSNWAWHYSLRTVISAIREEGTLLEGFSACGSLMPSLSLSGRCSAIPWARTWGFLSSVLMALLGFGLACVQSGRY